ncbi:flippase [Halomonas kalidii]|uniref:Flippase n=1 Tax=Halomonas kalidii TaxID=3043293 RepID=A0ABT6VK38_9GAMM|nr:flippase [Halomonas kalidii]MDI5934351.1 flippase [Halomonas kalidii]
MRQSVRSSVLGFLAMSSRPEGLRSQLVRGGLGSVVLKLTYLAFSFGTSVLLARILGPSSFGVYAYAMALVGLLLVPAQVGTPLLLVKEVARLESAGRFGELRGLLRSGMQAVILASSVVVIVIATIMAMGASVILPVTLEEFPLLHTLALVPILALISYWAAAMRGLRRVVLAQLPEQLVRPGLFFTFVGVLMWVEPTHFSASKALALSIAASMTAGLVAIAIFRIVLPAYARWTPPIYNRRRWTFEAWPLTLLAGVQVINSQVDMLLLGALADSESAGSYRVAVQGSLLVAFGLDIANMAIAPHLSRLYHAKEFGRLQRLTTMAARFTLSAALPVALVFILFGRDILGLVFGDPYRVAYVPLAILCIAQLINAGAGSVGTLLNMSGYARETVRAVSFATAINFFLGLVLIPRIGAEGAAVATASSVVFWNIYLLRKVRFQLNIYGSFVGKMN